MPVEVKWSEKVSPRDLKQIMKYHNGLVLNKEVGQGKIMNIDRKNIFDILANENAI